LARGQFHLTLGNGFGQKWMTACTNVSTTRIPHSRTHHHGQKFWATNHIKTFKLQNPTIVLIEAYPSHVIFLGTRPMVKVSASRRMDFQSFIAKMPEAEWAFQELHSTSNGKDIAQALSSGTCMAVSDGSYKDLFSTAAWILTNLASAQLLGITTVPGSPGDHDSYRSKLAGIYSTIQMVNHVCQYYQVTTGSILFGCDGLSALQ